MPRVLHDDHNEENEEQYNEIVYQTTTKDCQITVRRSSTPRTPQGQAIPCFNPEENPHGYCDDISPEEVAGMTATSRRLL